MIGYTTNTNREFYIDKDDYEKVKEYTFIEYGSSRYKSLLGWVPEEKRRIKLTKLLGYAGYDHINRNPMDNRKCNLRPATPCENSYNHLIKSKNSTGVIGVVWLKRIQKWVARIRKEKEYYLGSFPDFNDAVRTRLEAEKKYFGEFAPQRNLWPAYGIEDPFPHKPETIATEKVKEPKLVQTESGLELEVKLKNKKQKENDENGTV